MCLVMYNKNLNVINKLRKCLQSVRQLALTFCCSH